MKIALIALVTLAVVGGGAFTYQATRPEPAEQIPAGEVPGVITITALSAEVYLTEKGSLEVKVVKKSATTTVGATIRTSATGRALLETVNKKIVLDHDTQITIPADDNENVSKIRLLSGSVWSRVEKIFEKGEYYEVETQNAVAAVRGTSFNVSYLDETTTVAVEESAVAVTPVDEITGELQEEKEVIVSEGKKAVQEEDKEIVVSTVTANEKADAWYEFNIELEEKFEQSEKEEASASSDTTSDTAIEIKTEVQAEIEVAAPETKIVVPVVEAKTEPAPAPGQKTTESTSGGQTTTSEPLLPPGTVVMARVSPSQVSAKSTEILTLKGLGFLHVIALAIGQQDNNPTPVEGFKVVDDSTITFVLPAGLPGGVYNVVVVSDTEEGASLDKSLTIF